MQNLRKNVAANYRKINGVGPPRNEKIHDKENEKPNYVLGQNITKLEGLMNEFKLP
jgi:hypothetical protein